MIMKKDKTNQLIEAAAELIVTLRSWGFHIKGPLMTRDADTGKIVGGWAGEELEKLILEYRNNQSKNEGADIASHL